MKKTKTIATIALALLLTISALMVIAPTNPVDAQDDYGDLLQYEWTTRNGPADATHSSAGPAPDVPNVRWKFKEIGGTPTAFNGWILLSRGASGRPGSIPAPPKTWALNPFTGDIIWETTDFGGSILKLDYTRMLVGTACVEIATRTVLWTAPGGFRISIYSSDLKMGFSGLTAWDMNDLSQPPTLAWDRNSDFLDGRTMYMCYGDGKLFMSGLGYETAFNATTGETVWYTPLTGSTDYNGCYYQGKWLKASLDGRFYALDGETGEVLWINNPGTFWNFWGCGMAAAYGKVYMVNCDKHLYAIDVETGETVWKYKGPGTYYPGFPIVAGGKVIQTTGNTETRDPLTGEPAKAEYACVDAETGELVWKLPIMACSSHSDQHMAAYGNIYMSPVGLDEIWCIGNTPKNWPMFLGDAAHSSEGTGPDNLSLKWKYQTDGIVISSPSIVDGVVYVGSEDENIYALDSHTGDKIWSFETEYRVKSSPAVINGKVYTGTDDGNIYCLDALTGSQIWKNTEPGDVLQRSQSAKPRLRSSPTVVGGKVYVGSLDQNVYCFDVNTGRTLWTYATGGPVTSSPAVVDGAVYITSSTPRPSGTLYKLNADTGAQIWNLSIPVVRGTEMHASPTVVDDRIFLPADAEKTYCVNATNGEVIWTITGDMDKTYQYQVGSVLYAEGKLYMADTDLFSFACYDATDGSRLWQNYLGREIFGSPTYSAGRVYIGMDNRALYVLDAETGEKISWYEGFESNWIWSTPALYNRSVYVGSIDGNIYCLEEAPELPPIVAAQIDLSLSENTVVKGESLYIEGRVTNVQAAIPLTVSVDYPDSTYDDIALLTDVNGYFQVIYSPRMVGDLTVFAWCEGGDFYYGGATDVLALTVVNPESTPPSEVTPAPPTETYIAGSTIAILAGIAVAVFMILRKK